MPGELVHPRIQLDSDAAGVFAAVMVAERTQVRVYFEIDPSDLDQADPHIGTSTADPTSEAWHAVREWLSHPANRLEVVERFRILAERGWP